MTSEQTRLLDVNVMLALTRPDHLHSEAAHTWLARIPSTVRLATCPLTEASFIRLAMNPHVGASESFASCREKLQSLIAPGRGAFFADATSLANPRIDTSYLFGHQQVTDFHLVNLAASSDALLATFDRRIAEALAPDDRKYVELIPA